MVKYICPKCNKEFYKKSNYVEHTENKKRPCDNSDLLVPPKSTSLPPTTTDFLDFLTKEPTANIDNCVCMYCEKKFARTDSLQRHLNGRCRSKANYDELEKLKEDMKKIMQIYQKMENENVNLKNKIDEIEIIQKGSTKNNDANIVKKTVNNINNNQINEGVIINNIQLVQFGNEDISNLNLIDAMKIYLKSTGGNIASSMLKYINLNEQYPENNNICMTDLSREIVKIHNGKKFVYKKFKNVKDEILTKIVKNTRTIVQNFESNINLKKTLDTQNKLKINDVSLKIIDGVSAEDIVREEINEREKNLAKNNPNSHIGSDLEQDEEEQEEREFTFEERLRIEHLDKKREGMQKKTFENIKDELYNARTLLK
jgi:hypothetical protein